MTKLWMHPQAPGYSPGATFNGHWEDTTTAATYTRAMGPTKPDSRFNWEGSNSPSRAETSASNVWDVCLVRLVSPPLASNVTINGTIEVMGALQESSSAADFLRHVHVWVTQGDSTTARGVLLNTFIGTEVTTSLLGRGTGVQAVTSVAAQTGDRIVVEYGFRATNSVTTSYTGTSRLNAGENYADGTEGGSVTNINTFWVDISNALTFTSEVRVTQFSVETAIQQTIDPPTRISQMLVEAAIVPIPPTRLSQMVIEVMVLPPAPVTAVTWNPLPQRCQAKYWANLYDWNGNLVAVFDDFKPITIEHKINAFSNCTFSIDGLDDRINLFKLDYFLEVWRDIGDYSYVEFDGFHRSDQLQYTEGGHWIYTSYARSYEDLLMRRCLLYKDNYETTHSLKQAAAETVLKEFVDENAGPGASNVYSYPDNEEGRLVNGTIPHFNIEADQARGPIYTAHYTWRNLYEIAQEIAQGSSVDFAVVRRDKNQFEFRCYYPTRGTDKTNTLIFSPEYGNMSVPSYTKSRTEEVNLVAVLGTGEQKARRFIISQDAVTIAESPWNQRETTHDSRNSDDVQVYMDTGKEVLNNLKAKTAFTFDVMQTDASAYGYDYVLGDICTVKFGAITQRKKITAVSLNLIDGKEQIKIEFSDYPTI